MKKQPSSSFLRALHSPLSIILPEDAPLPAPDPQLVLGRTPFPSSQPPSPPVLPLLAVAPSHPRRVLVPGDGLAAAAAAAAEIVDNRSVPMPGSDLAGAEPYE